MAFSKDDFRLQSIICYIFCCLFLMVGLGCSASSSRGSIDGEQYDLSDENLELANRQRWEDGNIPAALADGLFQDIRFDYDSTLIAEEAREQIRKNAEVIKSDESLHVEVEGHCDSRGTSEYNLALGAARARSVANIMMSYGVPDRQISTVSYGEEIPLDPKSTEEAFAKNRRVHFAVYRVKGKN